MFYTIYRENCTGLPAALLTICSACRAQRNKEVINMSQKEFDFFALCFKQLERKIDRLLEIAENTEHGGDDGADSNENFPDSAKDAAN